MGEGAIEEDKLYLDKRFLPFFFYFSMWIENWTALKWQMKWHKRKNRKKLNGKKYSQIADIILRFIS